MQFVDDGAKARALIRRNTDLMGAIGQTKIYRRDATRLGENRGAPYDVIFLDPPYGKGLGERALESAKAGGWIAPGAVVIWEESAPVTVPDWAKRADERRYGDTALTILKACGV